jgi:glutaredoxin
MNWQTLNQHKIEMYSTQWCGDCIRLKRIFAEKKVNYTEVDIEQNPEAAKELQAATGRSAIPFVKIDGDFFIRGWHSEASGSWDDTIFFNEIEEKLS